MEIITDYFFTLLTFHHALPSNYLLITETPVFLPGKSHGWTSLAGYTLWGCKESDMTERLTHTQTDKAQCWLLRGIINRICKHPGSWTYVVSAVFHNWITHYWCWLCVCVGVCTLHICLGRGGASVVRGGGSRKVSIWPESRGLPTTWKRNETPVTWFFLLYLQK